MKLKFAIFAIWTTWACPWTAFEGNCSIEN